jgi:hypothetical protein
MRRLPSAGPVKENSVTDGIRIAVFCTKACNRLLVPLTAANQPKPHQNCGPR